MRQSRFLVTVPTPDANARIGPSSFDVGGMWEEICMSKDIHYANNQAMYEKNRPDLRHRMSAAWLLLTEPGPGPAPGPGRCVAGLVNSLQSAAQK